MNTIQEKVQAKVEQLAKRADENGSAKLSVCDAAFNGWDQDEYNHRHAISRALEGRGYSVSSSVNWGVIDISIVKPLTLV